MAMRTHPHDLPGNALGFDEHRVLHLRAVGLEVGVVAGTSLGSLGKPPDHHLLRLGSKQELEMSGIGGAVNDGGRGGGSARLWLVGGVGGGGARCF